MSIIRRIIVSVLMYYGIEGAKKEVTRLKKMWPEIGYVKLQNECTKFKIPYLIFDGVLDKNTPADLVQDYFDKIEAPYKELEWFKESGHNPLIDEPDKFKSLLKDRLIKIMKGEIK